jgi:hypothetical protein
VESLVRRILKLKYGKAVGYRHTIQIKVSEISDFVWAGSQIIRLSLVRLAGFEPAAYGLEVRCSIQLSYRRT